jgi:glutaryl-CoA dehydrogenase
MTQVTSAHLGESLGTDFFSVREQFTDEQWSHFITVRRFVDEEVVPVVGPYWERAEICWPLVRRLPELGIVGEDIKGYGCAGMSPMACGLVTMELHRGDGSLGVFLGVHAGLAMLSIAMCGSEEQKARWLPDMARMDKLGAFALTEPQHGSDSVALETSARRDGDGWVLNGRKRWIGLGTMADLVVVWARNTDDGQVNGFVVEKGSPGYQAQVIEGKVSLRSPTSRWTRCRCRPRTGCPGHARSRTPPGSWPPPGAPAPGRRWATPPPPTTPRCGTRWNGASSANRWPVSRSSSSGWCRCWRT